MPRHWIKTIRKKHGVFPYEVYLTNDNELFIIESNQREEEEQIPLGAQVLEINGISVDSFIKAISPYISFETINFRNDRISRDFEFMLYLVFKKVDQVNIKFKVFEESEAIISNMPYKEWNKHKKEEIEDRENKIKRGEPYNFKILKPGIAKIDIFSFAVSDIDKYNFFLNKTFKKIKKNKIHSLIIDIRGNYGGWPKVSSELFHYIHQGYFKTMAKSSMKISHPYRTYFTDRNPGLSNNNIIFPQRRHFVDLESVIYGKLNSYVDEEEFFNESPFTETHEFEGDCYVLIDRKSYSASSAFASTFQCYNMGILIGEPTGGTKIFRANAFTEILPRSKLILRISTTKLFTTCFNQENESVLPTIEVTPTIPQRVHNVDAQLNSTLLLIKKIQRKKQSK